MQAKAVSIDFSKVNDAATWRAFQHEVENLDIGVLSQYRFLNSKNPNADLDTVNNAGRSHAFPTDFAEVEDDVIDNIININISAALKLTRAILPGMIQRYISRFNSAGH